MNAGPLRQSWRGGGVPRLRNSRSSLQRLASAQGGGLFVALVLLSLYFSVSTGSFFTRSNILVVLEQISVLGIVAVPGAMLLVSGNLDLSVGSVAGLSAAIFGEFDKIFGWPVWLAALGALAVGAAWGTMNGILISYLGFSPVIVTLGGFAGAAGLAQTITSDSTRSAFGTGFDFLGNGTLVRDSGHGAHLLRRLPGRGLRLVRDQHRAPPDRDRRQQGRGHRARRRVPAAAVRDLHPVRHRRRPRRPHHHRATGRRLRADRRRPRTAGADRDPARRGGVQRRAWLAVGHARRDPVHRRPRRRPHPHQRGALRRGPRGRRCAGGRRGPRRAVPAAGAGAGAGDR